MKNAASKVLIDRVAEANRLHAMIQSSSGEAFRHVRETVVSAWLAGDELLEIKTIIKREQGHGYWEQYVERNFQGSLSTAKRYIHLRKKFTHVNDLPRGSLRSVYKRLEMISEEPPSSANPRPASVTKHLFLAQQLTTYILNIVQSEDVGKIRHLQGDLEDLHDAIHRLHGLHGS